MSLMQFNGDLLLVWLLSTLFIATLTQFEFRRVRFNFNVFFSPFAVFVDLLLVFHANQRAGISFRRWRCAAGNLIAGSIIHLLHFYGVYYVTIKRVYANAFNGCTTQTAIYHEPGGNPHLTGDLMGIALVSVAIFFMPLGFLLFGCTPT